MKYILPLAGIGALAFYYTTSIKNSNETEETEGLSTQETENMGIISNTCPDGYNLSSDGSQCIPHETGESLCPSGFHISPDGTECLPDDGGSTKNNSLDIDNPLALIAISLGTSLGISTAQSAISSKFASDSAKKLALEAEQKLAKETAEALGKKATLEASEALAKKQAEKTAMVLVKKSEMLGAKLAKTSALAGKISKAGNIMSKMKGTPFSLIVMIIAQVLIKVLGLDPENFEPCANGEFDFSSLPDWAKAIIGAVPFASDLFDLFSPVLCMKNSCEAPNINQNGLCYAPPKDGFNCEAFQCYKQYPEFENNGQLHTLNDITKSIIVDTGTIPDVAPENSYKEGLLYYTNYNKNLYNMVGGVLWEKCLGGYTDGGVFCYKSKTLPAGRVPLMGNCGNGDYRDDGTACWAVSSEICADDCSKGWDWCRRRGAFNECIGGCPLSCAKAYAKFSHYKSQDAIGSHEERIAGLNYDKCPNDMPRVPGVPTQCDSRYTKQSWISPPVPAGCGEGKENIAGLCYKKTIDSGYSRQSLGLLSQNCPPGSTDFGVGCTREQYSRGAGTIPLSIRIKERKKQEKADAIPPTCAELKSMYGEREDGEICMETICAEDEYLEGDYCVNRCKDGYSLTDGNTCSKSAGANYPEDSYQRRDLRPIEWGFQ